MSDNCTEEEKKYCEKFKYKNACKDGKCYNPKRKQVSNSKKSTSAQKVPNIPVPNISVPNVPVPNVQKAPDVLVDVIKTKKTKATITTILDFIKELTQYTLAETEFTDGLLERFAQNWELERIALMDRVLLRMATAELIHFETIPTKVTINEIIELAKRYSTDKSNVFINGVLDAVVVELIAENKLSKSGRGLIS